MKRWIARLLFAVFLTVPFVCTPVADASNISSFGTSHLIKPDGSYWMWGDRRTVPTQLVELSDVKKAVQDYVVTEEGKVYLVSKQFYSLEYEVYPVKALHHLEEVYYGYGRSLFLDREGKVYAAPKEPEQDLSIPDRLDRIQPMAAMDDVKDIGGYVVESHRHPWVYQPMWLFLKNDGTVWRGQADADAWERVPLLDGTVDIDRNLALKEDGSVWTLPTAWSEDGPGEPEQVAALQGIESIHTNGRSSVAVDNQGQVWFWGATVTGFSDGTTPHDHKTPILLEQIDLATHAYVVDRSLIVHTLDDRVLEASINVEKLDGSLSFRLLASNIQHLEAAWSHIIMQQEDGTLFGWGANDRAQLGTGNYESAFERPVALQRPISLRLNEKPVQLANGIMLQGGQAFIPLRSVFEQLGATISWDHPTQTVTIQRTGMDHPDLMIEIHYANGEVLLNGQLVELENEPFIINGSAYLPLRFISETLGAQVDWNQPEESIHIIAE
ncbi:hypothetical protein FE782_24600 [Paenibacillus antri]|uniref:Copper amine oxidase-like N-terminal domain-containing protein n=1 Tax=Paenibacillus antri TaxID=2582848 RepID=A0A5R9GA38_9BACL|nr:stalk domain-containing protein [Paenibacillus antri]TLS49573.1 hypothetical protein FE782_24600 [Paenibacillus antri]